MAAILTGAHQAHPAQTREQLHSALSLKVTALAQQTARDPPPRTWMSSNVGRNCLSLLMQRSARPCTQREGGFGVAHLQRLSAKQHTPCTGCLPVHAPTQNRRAAGRSALIRCAHDCLTLYWAGVPAGHSRAACSTETVWMICVCLRPAQGLQAGSRRWMCRVGTAVSGSQHV